MQSKLETLTRREFLVFLGGVTALPALADEASVKPENPSPKTPNIDPSLEKYYNEAMSKFPKEEEKPDGLKMLLGIDKKFPGSILALFLAANAVYYNSELSLQQKHAWALERYDKAISLDNKFVGAYVNRGIVHYLSVEPTEEEVKEILRTGNFLLPDFRRKAYRKALIDLEKAAIFKPSFSAFYNRGIVMMHADQELEAVKEFQKAIKVGLKNTSWEGYLPRIQDDAVSEGLVGANPVCMVSAFAKYILDNHCDKVKGYRIAVQEPTTMIYLQDENDPEAFANYQIGSCYARKNVRDYDKAIEHYSKAIELNPNVPSFYQLLGVVQFGTGKHLEALQTREKHAEVLQHIAKISRSWRE